MKQLVTGLLLSLFITGSLGQDLRPVGPTVFLRAQALSPTSITVHLSLSWPKPSHYEITYNYIGPCDGFSDSGMVADGAPLIVSGSVEHLLTGLQEFSSYKITAKVFYETEVTILTSETVTTLPAAPSAGPELVTATAVGPTTVFIQWGEVPCVERNSEIVDYQVRYRNTVTRGDVSFNGSAKLERAWTIGKLAPLERAWTIRGLAPLTGYLIQVAAIGSDTVNESVAFSEPVFVRTTSPASVPAPVSSLAADSQVTSVIITWEAPSVKNETITEYQVACYPAGANEQGRTIETEEVYKLAEANELGHVIHTEDITVKITELQPGTTYVVIVRAVSEAGAGSAVTIPVTTEDIPRVQNIRASADPLNDTAVVVSWSPLPADSVPPELLSYIVYYSILSSTELVLEAVGQEHYPSNVTSVTVSNLEGEELYVFQVAAGVEVDRELFVGERSLVNEDSIVRTGSSRDANGHRCLDEEERSDAINYGMLAAIVGGTFATTALLFIIILVATLIHWRRKHRNIVDGAKVALQWQSEIVNSTSTIRLKDCAAYGVRAVDGSTNIDSRHSPTSLSYAYIDIV